jgi:peptidoglycan/LPS O-acetylase OafA/YrhL
MTFRYDIGLLRAIAVCFVIFYHYHFPFFDGGYIGVDIFFVISGFLMTKIILTDIKRDRFSYFLFIERRMKRIVPALLGVTVVMLIILPLLYFDVDMKLNAKYIALSLAFISNIYYGSLSGDYFSPDAQDNFFLHSWSLAVEWQFYVLYPIVLWLLKDRYLHHFKQFRFILIILVLLSLTFWLGMGSGSSWAFYLMPTRIWEFLIGGLAFLYSQELKMTLKRFLTPITAMSLVLMLVSAVFIRANHAWSSSLVVIPVLATAVLLAIDHQLAWFENRGIQFLGKISYSLYLWHWPFYVLYRKFDFLMQWRFSIFVPFFLSFIFAILSYYLLERKKNLFGTKTLTIFGCMVALFAVILFLVPKHKLWNKIRLVDNQYLNYFQQDEHQHLNPCNCYITRSPNYNIYDKEECLKIDLGKENILLIGDSHAAQLSTAFRNALTEDQNLLEMSLSLTFPFPDPKGYDKSVQLWNFFYTEFLPKNEDKIDKVFISVHWLMNTYGEMNYTPKEIEQGLKRMTTLFDSYGLEYYFIGQTELYRVPYRQVALKKMFNPALDEQQFSLRKGQQVNEFLKRIIPKQHYIDIYKYQEIRHNSLEKGMPYMFDKHHLSAFGASQVVEYLLRKEYL